MYTDYKLFNTFHLRQMNEALYECKNHIAELTKIVEHVSKCIQNTKNFVEIKIANAIVPDEIIDKLEENEKGRKCELKLYDSFNLLPSLDELRMISCLSMPAR